MTTSWPTKKIGELGKVVTGKTPSTSEVRNFGGIFPFITIPDMAGRRDITSTARTLSNQGAQILRTSQLPSGAVMMSCIATIGKCGITTRPSFTNQQINSLICKEDIEPKYVYYCFTQLRQALETAGGGGSIYTNVSKSRFEGIEIPVPPLAEQKRIAGILGALDDKIELNRKMNETLEQMARALFKSWFVDFDPVHAKAAGRQPAGMDNATADLFPDSFLDSELGKNPTGWKIMTVGEALECVGGATPSTTETKYWEGGIHHWTTPKDFSSLASPFLLDTERKLTDAGIAKISSGLLPAGTLLLSSRAPIGYIAIATMPVAINQGFIALKCNENASNFFMLNWCKANMAEIESRATGTTFPEISKLNFRPIRVCLPPKELMSVFTSKVSPMYGKVVANLRQSRNLSSLRDTLLPRLLSGGN
jgi:type I restriction enzyme S subunit